MTDWVQYHLNLKDDSMTGPKHHVLDALVRSVAQICRADSNVRRFYIGIASGANALDAMDRRYDDYKYEHGINEMIAVYESTSQQNVRDVEAYLTEMFIDRHDNINRTGGGGGGLSSGPYFYVYVAVKRVGKF